MFINVAVRSADLTFDMFLPRRLACTSAAVSVTVQEQALLRSRPDVGIRNSIILRLICKQ